MSLVFTQPQAMRLWAESSRMAGRRIALVPTMGALHAGHVALIEEARRHAELVVVAIFVNPIQFNRRDDFDGYPRDLETDRARCDEADVDVVYAPSAGAMYPEGFEAGVEVTRLSDPLCGAERPGHFRGVTTVVTKLFNAVRPHVAVFGEKDYQQLAVIRRMAVDLDFGIEIVGLPTVREPDGLALSSRNRLLSEQGRTAARCVPLALAAAADRLADGETRAVAIADAAVQQIEAESAARLEYAELRDPATLEAVEVVDAPTLLALAVWVDGVRLIDNRMLNPRGTNP
jgi:pantoate--beta-alanine ligase